MISVVSSGLRARVPILKYFVRRVVAWRRAMSYLQAYFYMLVVSLQLDLVASQHEFLFDGVLADGLQDDFLSLFF